MKPQAIGMGSKDAAELLGRTPIAVAVVTAQPMLSLRIQDAINQRPDVDLQLVAPAVADLAAFAARERLDVILCEPFDAKDISRLLQPGQRLLVLGRDTTPRSLMHDLAANRPSQPFGEPSGLPAPRDGEEERRSGAAEINRRRLVGWLLRQQPSDEPGSTDMMGPTGRAEWLLHSLPHLGRATTLIFLDTERLQSADDEWDHLLGKLRATLRDEDAVLRLDDTTLVVLTATGTPSFTSGLLTRISWRLWPTDPLAITASSVDWRPGLPIAEVVAEGRRALDAARAQAPHPSSSGKDPAPPSASLSELDAETPTSWLVSAAQDWQRGRLEIEPWCDPLPNLEDEDELRYAVEAQEEEEFGHSGHGRGVARVAAALAEALGLTAGQVDELHTAALLHDAGKISLDRALWGSRGTITAWQRRLMEAHTSFGSELADRVGLPDSIVRTILHHHERWDGSGYPAHLAGEAIPLSGRILFVAEVVDSMLRTSYRRPVMKPGHVAAVLEAGAGHRWDPRVARHAARMVRGTA
jgi:putative nucleotidyltransferase with HDIG domain